MHRLLTQYFAHRDGHTHHVKLTLDGIQVSFQLLGQLFSLYFLLPGCFYGCPALTEGLRKQGISIGQLLYEFMLAFGSSGYQLCFCARLVSFPLP